MNKYRKALNWLVWKAREEETTYIGDSQKLLFRNLIEEYGESLQELIEKATPKKPVEEIVMAKESYYDDYGHEGVIHNCPNCGAKAIWYGLNYCPECGQALDWEGMKRGYDE